MKEYQERLLKFMDENNFNYTINNNPTDEDIARIMGYEVNKPILTDNGWEEGLELYKRLRWMSKENELLIPLRKTLHDKLYKYENDVIIPNINKDSG